VGGYPTGLAKWLLRVRACAAQVQMFLFLRSGSLIQELLWKVVCGPRRPAALDHGRAPGGGAHLQRRGVGRPPPPPPHTHTHTQLHLFFILAHSHGGYSTSSTPSSTELIFAELRSMCTAAGTYGAGPVAQGTHVTTFGRRLSDGRPSDRRLVGVMWPPPGVRLRRRNVRRAAGGHRRACGSYGTYVAHDGDAPSASEGGRRRNVRRAPLALPPKVGPLSVCWAVARPPQRRGVCDRRATVFLLQLRACTGPQ
jgi:hypothetical protein